MKSNNSNQEDASFYEKIVARHLDSMLKRADVISFGVGYKTVGKLRTEAISLVVEVKKKLANVSREQRIPEAIDGVPTDVIEDMEGNQQPPQLAARESSTKTPQPDPPSRVPNKLFDPLMGSIPIRNPKLQPKNAGVLGAIVFDAKTGDPMGLSVQHAIGNQKAGDMAQKGDPIHQPMKQDAKYKIGTLYKFDTDYDVALFKLSPNLKRDYVTKLKGNTIDGKAHDIDLGEPINPKLGMKVECWARHTYSTGQVDYIYWRRRKSGAGYICLMKILFDDGFKTQGGDSGSLWIDRDSKRPVGLHRRFFTVYYSMRTNRYGSAALASSVYQMSKDWHRLRFTESKSQLLEPELRDYQTCLVDKGAGFVALCHQPGAAEKLVIKKFDQKFKKSSERANDVYAMSGFAAAPLIKNSDSATNPIYAFWRSASENKIQFGKLDAAGTKLTKIRTFAEFKTMYKPSAVSLKSSIILAFIEAGTNRISIATSSNADSWSFVRTSYKSSRAPAITVFNRSPVLAWVAYGNQQLRIAALNRRGKSYEIPSYRTISGHYTDQDPSLAAGGGKLFLAYTTTRRDELRILESYDRWNWSTRNLIESASKAAPVLFYFGGDLVCWRRQV